MAPGKSKRRRRVLRIIAAAVLIVLLITGGAVWWNNYSLTRPSSDELTRAMDAAVARGLAWLVAHEEDIVGHPNPALTRMLSDVSSLDANDVADGLVDRYMEKSGGLFWARLVDSSLATPPPPGWRAGGPQSYQRWIAHAISPAEVPLSDGDREALFSPVAHRTGTLTHQLFALVIYRQDQRYSEELSRLIDQLCERVAVEAALDFRVTDLYLQRVAFLLAAGRDDLVRRRWVERLIGAQRHDGGWAPDWHGWQPSPFRFESEGSMQHPTVQAIWALVMLRHRFPDWAEARCAPE